MPKKHRANLQAAAQTANAKTAIDLELFEHLHAQREVMRAALQSGEDGIDEVAQNMVRIYDLLLTYGRFFEPTLKSKKFKTGDRNQCYGNSVDLVVAHDDLSYCEGYVVIKGMSIPMEHAWCVTTDDAVVDVTLRKPVVPVAYFGVVFNSLFAASHDLPAIESVLIRKVEPAIWRA